MRPANTSGIKQTFFFFQRVVLLMGHTAGLLHLGKCRFLSWVPSNYWCVRMVARKPCKLLESMIKGWQSVQSKGSCPEFPYLICFCLLFICVIWKKKISELLIFCIIQYPQKCYFSLKGSLDICVPLWTYKMSLRIAMNKCRLERKK